MAIDLGVVVGRFQVANLSDGHRYLIDHARQAHRQVLVLVGSSNKVGTLTNPLSYAIRERMIRQAYDCPNLTILPLPDFPQNNKRWSHHLDVTIEGLGYDLRRAVLYAGRDSFAPHYEGKWEVVEIDSGMDHISGSAVRRNIGRLLVDSEDFRRGVIWLTQNQAP